MVVTMTELSVKMTTTVDCTTLEVDDSLENMIGMIVFQVKIATVDQVKSSKTGDFATKEATTHLESRTRNKNTTTILLIGKCVSSKIFVIGTTITHNTITKTSITE
jgi:hypothetical protein